MTFVAIMGGSAHGAGLEREQLDGMHDLFQKRKTIEDVMRTIIKDTACCMTCGCSACRCCDGMNSGLFLTSIAANRMAFCSPTKSMGMELVFADPTELQDYITGKATVLVDARNDVAVSVTEAPVGTKQDMVRP